MPLRDITVRYTLNEMEGDETYELWLKAGGADWALYDSGDVGAGPTQDFLLLGLTEAELHVTQLRSTRLGRYRVGYLNGNPDLWPVASRLEFYPGLDFIGAPTIDSTVWSRTSPISQKIAVTITPNADFLDLDLKLKRDGVLIHTFAAPLAGTPVSFDDVDPGIAANHTYDAYHQGPIVAGDLDTAIQWAGPAKPVGVAETANGDYTYTLEWDAPVAGAVTQIQDDYYCLNTYEDVYTSGADDVTAVVTDDNPGGGPGTTLVLVHARLRHEVTAFAITDVSDWTEVIVDETIYDDDVVFRSCP